MNVTGGRILVLVASAAVALSASHAHAQELDSDAKKMVASFGSGVVVQTGGKATISQASDYALLAPGTMTFKIVSGDNSGTKVQRTVKAKAGASGTYEVMLGKTHTMTYVQQKEGVFSTMEINTDTKSLSKFNPAEPVLVDGATSGSPSTRTVKVEVYDVGDPKTVTHSGSLKCTYEVLGTFKVKTEAGTYDAIGVRVKYDGSVGPASITDTNYVFFAKGVGPVAMRARSHISAFIVYDKQVKESMVLVSAPKASSKQ
jgi:hypothetical protein